MDHERSWEVLAAPLIWVELIYRGDTQKMPKFFGFAYTGHYFISDGEKLTFYKNKVAEASARKFGPKKYTEASFFDYFGQKTQEIEANLNSLLSKFEKEDLGKKNNKELCAYYNSFLDNYSNIVAFYRFSRTDFYEDLFNNLRSEVPEPFESNVSLLLSNRFDELKFEISPELRFLFKGLKKIGERRFELHKVFVGALEKAGKLFGEIGKRAGLDILETKMCTSKEIIDFLLESKEIDNEEIRNRLKGFKFIYHDDFFEVVLRTNDKKEDLSDSGEVKGVCVSKRAVLSGRARVFKDSLAGTLPEALGKMRKGEILIASSTAPDMMIAIKKAKAIVTDVGGLLSHAAIVSRELGVPCVINTRIATKVFKNGDLIEVDAERGIVRKL
ncbi:MAG: PEP-utilizing enzyme [Candidatus Nanoarchaeia archaeon]|nr:PEP-utilizing enzyme [Candidatus Nanoarchaeia archaeon]